MVDKDTTGSRVRENRSHGSVEGRTQKCDPSTLAQEIPAEFLTIPEVEEAMNELKNVSQDPEKRRIYEERIRWQDDEINARAHARNEGIREGRMEGRMEEKREMARSAVAMNMPLGQISQLTGLSSAEIKSLLPEPCSSRVTAN